MDFFDSFPGGVIVKAKLHVLTAVFIPIALGLLSGFAISRLEVPSQEFTQLEFLLNTIISCSATISGFILASVTILVGATSSEIMRKIRKHGALPELRWRYTEALILGLVVIFFFTFLGAAVDESNSVSNLYLSLSAGLLVAYICSVISTCYYLLSIIGLINEEPPTVDKTPSVPSGEFR